MWVAAPIPKFTEDCHPESLPPAVPHCKFLRSPPFQLMVENSRKIQTMFFWSNAPSCRLRNNLLRPFCPLGHDPCPLCDGHNAAVECDAFDPCLQWIHLCLHLRPAHLSHTHTHLYKSLVKSNYSSGRWHQTILHSYRWEFPLTLEVFSVGWWHAISFWCTPTT